MSFLWSWKSDNTSPASFEKTLSTLSGKITKATARLDNNRQQGRRFKALWTLYSSFAYLLYLMIVALVVGWKNWGPIEYTAVVGGPLLIYAVRLTLSTFYEYRISKAQANVDTLQKQRDITIDKLKAATKYNTTQQLLEKYGGTPSRSKSSGHPIRKTDLQGGSNSPKDVRTRFVPPATANIPGRNIPASLPSTPQRSTPASVNLGSIPFTAAAATPPWQQQSSPVEQTAEFAPNAFSAAPQYAQVGERPKWYDRFMDILLGEDETNPRNRIILICNNCRLVNGQAPPGVKQLEDVGTWRCSGCGVMNGEETEAKRLVAQISKQAKSREALSLVQQEESSKVESDQNDDEVVLVGREVDHESDITQYSDDELEALVEGEQEPIEEGGKLQEVEEEAKPEKPKRGRPKGSVKKKA